MQRDALSSREKDTNTDVGAGAPLPWNDPEYVRFVQALDNTNTNTNTNKISTDGMSETNTNASATHLSEVYQSLLKRERRVLDTVDRVVNDARKTELASLELVDLPIRSLAYRAMRTGKSMLDDLVEANNATDVGRALVSGDRKVFLGAALILIAVASALVTSFSPST